MITAPIRGTELADEPYTAVAEVALGLTLYLAEPVVWAQQAAARALEAFMELAPVGSFQWYTTSVLTEWQRVGSLGAKTVASHLSYWQIQRPRHLFSFEIVDDADVVTTGFSYREFDSSRGGPRASILEITLPQLSDPQMLLRFAEKLTALGPWLSGVGGYVARWNRYKKNSAFWTLHKWARRYLGLDLQDAEEMSWNAVDALPGANWLTLIGGPLAEAKEIDIALLTSREWAHDVTVHACGNGVLVRAGASPTVGDRNQLDYPRAYAEVARRLAPWLVEEPPEFWGEFWREKDTKAWLRRFIEPDGWQ